MRDTVFSPDRKYRYTLWRQWGGGKDAGRFVNFIGLNPSTADESHDDPTIRRCIAFAKSWGFAGLCMTNLFAWRGKSPREMKKAAHPVGEDNQKWLFEIANQADLVVAAWGTNGGHIQQDKAVGSLMLSHMISLRCIRKTYDGHPEHPLYLPGSLTPIPF